MRTRTKITLALAVIAIAWACKLDLIEPNDPSYEKKCVFIVDPGDTLEIHRATFERCEPVAIYMNRSACPGASSEPAIIERFEGEERR